MVIESGAGDSVTEYAELWEKMTPGVGRAGGLHGAGADPATADMNHETQYVSGRHQSTTERLSKND